MSTPTPREIANWLDACSERHDELVPQPARPIVATFQLPVAFRSSQRLICASYLGGAYWGANRYTADMQAVRDGRHKAGDVTWDLRYYFVGKLRPIMLHKTFRYENKIVYRLHDADWPTEGERAFPADSDWYISGFILGDIRPEHREYHPFGPSFTLCRWPHETFQGDRIDKHDDLLRTRANVGIATWTPED